MGIYRSWYELKTNEGKLGSDYVLFSRTSKISVWRVEEVASEGSS
jgi:hypothetical protein